MLTSSHNPRVRAVRDLLDRRQAREDSRRFVVEGVRLVEAALDAGARPVATFYAADLAATSRGAALLTRLRAAGEAVEVSDHVLRALSDTQTPQGVVVVVPFLDWSARAPGGAAPLILVVDGVRDPGNLGSLLRSAAAAGVDRVLLAPGGVDLYNPKVVRAGMGAHFLLPITSLDWDAVAGAMMGLTARAATADAPLAYDRVDWTAPSALLIGGEAEGVSVAGLRLARETVAIPMRAGVESLNAAMAGTVILFEAARQRREGLEIGD